LNLLEIRELCHLNLGNLHSFLILATEAEIGEEESWQEGKEPFLVRTYPDNPQLAARYFDFARALNMMTEFEAHNRQHKPSPEVFGRLEWSAFGPERL
jgi:hypothetical protein